MKGRFFIWPALLVLTLSMTGSPSALASETHHGKFTAGSGLNDGSGQDGYAAGTYALTGVSGTWSLSIGARDVKIGGTLKNVTCPLAPCPFVLNLSAANPWVEVTEGSRFREFTSTVVYGPVTFDLSFDYYPSGKGILVATIDGCPHGWVSWTIS